MTELVKTSLVTTGNRAHSPTIWHCLTDAWRRQRAVWATRRALESLDDRILRDIGVSRHEIGSYQARHHLEYWPWGNR